MGAEVELLPVIAIQEIEDKYALDAALSQLDSYSWIIFTSSSTVRNFVAILGKEKATRFLRKATVAALGPVTAGTVESFGKKPEILPRENTIQAVLEAIREFFA
jgi:uroporphyrinogen III methyltransferase/synthase